MSVTRLHSLTALSHFVLTIPLGVRYSHCPHWPREKTQATESLLIWLMSHGYMWIQTKRIWHQSLTYSLLPSLSLFLPLFIRHINAHTPSQSQWGNTEGLKAGKRHDQTSILGRLPWWEFGNGRLELDTDQGCPARILELAGGCSRHSGGKDVNLIQGWSHGDIAERMDPRDSGDIKSTEFERETEKVGFTFKPVSLEVRWCNSLKLGIRFINRLDEELSLGPVWVELSVQYPYRSTK